MSPDSTGDSFGIPLRSPRRLCRARISFEIVPRWELNGDSKSRRRFSGQTGPESAGLSPQSALDRILLQDHTHADYRRLKALSRRLWQPGLVSQLGSSYPTLFTLACLATPPKERGAGL